jgi:hypothetical protein
VQSASRAHVDGVQAALDAYFRHAPAPSQSPSSVQAGEPSSAHALFGSVPAATGPHVPSLPEPFFAAVHATQVEEHTLSQQTPSAQ